MTKIMFIIQIVLILTIYSCTNPKKDIPDITLISEVIFETIKQDSFDLANPININLINRYVYQLQNDSIPPPFITKDGIPFVFNKYLGDTIDSFGFAPSDSEFISQQIFYNKNLVIDTNIFSGNINFDSSSVLKYEKQNIYVFLIPIFNKDKSSAIVEYEYRSACCGYGIMVYFRKVQNKWVMIESFGTWTS